MLLSDGRPMEFEKIYPLDAAYDTLSDVPAGDPGEQALQGAGRLHDRGTRRAACGATSASPGLDIVVHSLANGPEVKKPLVETSRAGYLTAVSVSAYSNVSLVRHLAPDDAPGRVVPVAHLHGGRARHPRLRRRHVVGQGSARSGHTHPCLRGGTPLGRPHQRDQRRSPRLARRGAIGGASGFIETHDQLQRGQQPAAPASRRAPTWAPPRRSSRARWPRRSPAAWSTWTTATTRWAWQCPAAGIEPPAAS